MDKAVAEEGEVDVGSAVGFPQEENVEVPEFLVPCRHVRAAGGGVVEVARWEQRRRGQKRATVLRLPPGEEEGVKMRLPSPERREQVTSAEKGRSLIQTGYVDWPPIVKTACNARAAV